MLDAKAAIAPAPAFPWAAIAAQLRSVQAGLKRISDSETTTGWLTQAAKVLGSIGSLGVLVWYERTESGWSAPLVSSRDADPAVLQELCQLAGRAAESGPATTRVVDARKTTWFAVAMPVGTAGCLAATFQQHSEPDDWFVSQLDHAAAELASRLAAKSLTQVRIELSSSAAVIELATRIEAAESLEAACQMLVEEVGQYLSVTVALGLVPTPTSHSKLQAISGTAGVDTDSPRSRLISAAIDEVLVHDRVTCFSASLRSPPLGFENQSGGSFQLRGVENAETQRKPFQQTGLLTHQRLVADGICHSVIGVPLKDRDGQLLGAWVCLGDEQLTANEAAIDFLRACEFRLGDTIKLLRRAERSRLRRLLDRCRKKVGGSLTKVIVGGSVAVAALMAVPWPHRVKCDCQLEPVTRRFVAAPFDGTLEKAFVEPGQVVEAGELLAQMDDREINWEKAGVDAEQQRAAKERDSKLANHKIAESQLAKYEVERLELRRRLLSHRGEHLEIRSPIAGLVIVGDLKKSEGVPLTTGKNLFEIAPLDRMVVEVAIPERDRIHADIGQDVDITLEGFSGEHWSGKVVRIHPRSEIRDQENVFIGEVELENVGNRLLPGLHGHARLASGWRSVGWLLFHRPVEALVFWMGW